MTLHPSITHWRTIKTFNTMEQRFIEMHGDKYDYSKSVYTGTTKKLTIVCKKHGEFSQLANDHARGNGCRHCSIEKTHLSNEEFIAKVNIVHDNKYSYLKTVLKHTKKEVIITCPTHGDFLQRADRHLSGHGCIKCGHETRATYIRSTKEEFITKAKKIHGDKYCYANVQHVDNLTRVNIVCKVHGQFNQKPSCHLTGSGCKGCASHGFDTSKPGTIYYLKIKLGSGNFLYKIGITNRTVEKRFNNTDLTKIEIVRTKHFNNGQDAYDLEQRILKKHKEFRYRGTDVLASGNTELFTKDVLGFDKKEP